MASSDYPISNNCQHMLTTIYLVRHADSIYTPDEYNRPLSKLGHQDAKILARLFEQRQIDSIFSSPYIRSIQTVEYIGLVKKLPVQVVEHFKERIIANHQLINFYEDIKKLWYDEHFCFAGGESNFAAQRRGIKALHQILEEWAGKKVIIGSHGNLITLILNYYDKKFDYSFWKALDRPDVYEMTFEGFTPKEILRIWTRNK